jgi:hydroxybutyrate-dimer hydrolase
VNVSIRTLSIIAASGLGILVNGCGGGGGGGGAAINVRPDFIIGTISMVSYNGTTDDLATAGLGKTGLAGASPTAADPINPTAAELRKIAIYNNYRALVDVNSPNGGYGTLYGPNVDVKGNATTNEGKIAGTEYLAFADDGTGMQNVTLMVQIPATFDRNNPCIVTATSSGSRGVYGAIGTAGEWGLKHGCVVAYADKGSGAGFHDLATNTVNTITGVRQAAATAGKNSNFTAFVPPVRPPEFGLVFSLTYPNRFAVKHAHSQQNPEKDWGRDTLRAVKFAFYELNEERGDAASAGLHLATFTPTNTIVIASSASNGAGAALQAAEQDTEGLIGGVAVSEPSIQLQPNPALTVTRGATTLVGTGRPLYDYFTTANLYQPCAALSPAAAAGPGAALVSVAPATNRCASLKAKGLLTASDTAGQALESLNILHTAGWQTDSDVLHASLYALATPAIAATYSNTYGRFSVYDNLCGLSFAATDAANKPVAIAPATLAVIFGTANGVPPGGGVNIVNNQSPGGPLRDPVSISPSTGLLDYDIDAAICQRNLFTGTDAAATQVKTGINEVLRTANLHGKPAIIVHGRNDALIPVPFTSRPYFGQNKITEGTASQLMYIEVTNAQHFDTFIDNAAVPGYDSRFVPLHYYFVKAMDAMYARLKSNTPLPPSQVVRTVPRGGTPGAAPAITLANVPPISATPAAGNQITFSNNTVTIPD